MKNIFISYLVLISAHLLSQVMPYGEEFHINTYTENDQYRSQITTLPGSGFVVCWVSDDQDGSGPGVYGQLFSEKGKRISSEFRVNTYTYAFQNKQQITSLPGGEFVVCWESSHQDSSFYGVYGQLFSADGNQIGSEFRINTYIESQQWFPQITSLQTGGFVVCWMSYSQDGSSYGVYGQLFSEDGKRIGNEFRVNTYTVNGQHHPQIASLQGGGFVVCWVSDDQDGSRSGVYGQLFSEDGKRIGNEFHVNTHTYWSQYGPQITSLPNGGLAVCWESYDQDAFRTGGVYGQLFSKDSKRIGDEFRINTHTKDDQDKPQITSLSNGNFVVCWQSFNQDGSRIGVYGQLFSGDGYRIGSEFRINTYTEDDQYDPQITSLPSGGFVACWTSKGQDGSAQGVYGQLFSQDGKRIGGEFRINTYTEYDQWRQRIINLSDSGFVVSWTSDGQDGSGLGIYGKRFAATPLNHILIPFTLQVPCIGTIIQPGPVVFEWNQASGKIECYPWEVAYDLIISTDPGFISPLVVGGIEDTTYTIDYLRPGYTYYWKVMAKNISGESLWCDSSDWNFHMLNGDSVEVISPTFREFELVNTQMNIVNQDYLVLNWQRASIERTVYPPLLFYDLYMADNLDFKNARVIQGINDTTCTLDGLSEECMYYWKVLAYDSEGNSIWSKNIGQIQIISIGEEPPEQFYLYHNYPNPFNLTTKFRYNVPINGFVTLKIYDIQGRLIRVLVEAQQSANLYVTQWDGKNAANQNVVTGIYFYKFTFKNPAGKTTVISRKMSLIR